MTTEERFPPAGPYNAPSGPRIHGEEKTLRSEKLQIERKTFMFVLKENPRGRFVRITEDVSGRRDTIIVPATGLEDFRKVLEIMAQETDPPLG